MGASACVDGSTSHKDLNKAVIGYPCHNDGGNQVYMKTLCLY
jgi:hypothetical protein